MYVLPSLPGLQWNIVRSVEFSTLTRRSVSLDEFRFEQASYPLWTYEFSWDILRDQSNTSSPSSPYDELRKLLGFFLIHRGAGRAFYYTDPDDGTVTDMSFGAGDGSTTAFQLTRAYGAGGFTLAEPVQNLNGAPTAIKDNGSTVAPSGYSVGATGIVTFNTPPTSGHTLTWSGSYYQRLRFVEDASNWRQFMKNLWENRKMSCVGSVANKV